MFILLAIALSLVITNGESYTVIDSVMVLLLALIISISFAYGRCRLREILSANFIVSDAKQRKETIHYLTIIQRTSTIVIVANLGIIVAQIYSVIKIQNFEQLIQANNDPVSVTLCLSLIDHNQYFCFLDRIWIVFVSRLQHPSWPVSDLSLPVQILSLLQKDSILQRQ